jgi:hypothetical protein
MRRTWSWPNLRQLSRRSKLNHKDSLYPDQDLNLGPPEYKAVTLTIRTRCSIEIMVVVLLLLMMIARVLEY